MKPMESINGELVELVAREPILNLSVMLNISQLFLTTVAL